MQDLPFKQQLAWAETQMPVTRDAAERLPDLSQVRLAYAGHLSLNITTALASLLERGARLFLTTCNLATVRDEVVHYLKDRGAEAHTWKDISTQAYQEGIDKALAWQPTHTCEMGADLTVAAHAAGTTSIRAALEATASGINRLPGLGLRYPVFNWDDLPIKEGLHNRHMVGLTTWQTFFERTWLSLHGKHVVVVGYGLVGQGVAATATGAPGVVDAGTMALLKPGCFLINVGHTADEIDLSALPERRAVVPFVEACRVGDHEVYLLAGGSMANLTAGHGDSLNAFDITSAVMVAGVGFVATLDETWPNAVHSLPETVWRSAAARAVDLEGW